MDIAPPASLKPLTPNFRQIVKTKPGLTLFPFSPGEHRLDDENLYGSTFEYALKHVVRAGKFETEIIDDREYFSGGDSFESYAASVVNFNLCQILGLLDDSGELSEVQHHKWRWKGILSNTLKIARALEKLRVKPMP